MNDIDFDEIDRAVSSVTNSDTPVRPSVESEPTIAAFAPSSAPLVQVEPIAPTIAPSPAARRSSGRFMDVVHPSSDMRPPAPTAPSLHREEVVVRERTVVTTRPEPATISSSAFHWPDPIAVAEPVVVVEPPVLSMPEEVPAIVDVPTIPEEASPLESPFLSDAKVEKRPLGAFSTASSDGDLELIDDFPAPTFGQQLQPDEASKSDDEADTDIPRELHEDVLLLEAHTETEATPEPAATKTAPEAPAPVGPTSITQQYQEQPSTVSQPSGSIYDTEAYHQPLVHPVKKRSSALIILWIVALILVGGGIGAAIYFVVRPMLG